MGTGITGFTKTDVIVAYGYIQNYGGDTVEMTGKSGDYPYALAVVDSCAAGHDFTDATCTTPKTCKVCDTTEGEVLPHEYVNGVCSCGAKEPTGAETTVSFTAKDAADQEGWTNSTKYSTLVYDGVTFTAAGTDTNTGKYYTTGGGSWRFYSSGNATLTITVPEGASIKSVKITWSEGGLSCNGTAMKSGTVFNVEGNSVVIKATAKTFITAIEVVYA